MANKRIHWLLCFAAICVAVQGFSQLQTCPLNINFKSGDLSFWSARTGLVGGGTINYPEPNSGVTTIPEYTIGVTGIQVITTSYIDKYGSFPTIPTINGYAYKYSVLLGSTSTSHDLNSSSRNPGGFTRAITYTISVPAGPASVPYTMTYAYAMVLEDGTHNSNQQPLFKAILTTANGVIDCASPYYYLPTFNNAGGNGGGSTGATLDVEKAKEFGFTISPVLFFSYSGNNGAGRWLQDVWTKGWREVTFDLSPYRGQVVTLTFEADNCTPGGHFAYAYVAMRDVCAGLEISGNAVACTNTSQEYSIPALADATYDWQVPAGWTVNGGANTNIINVTPGTNPGYIVAHQVNSCADLRDTLQVTTTPPTVPGRVNSDNTVCSGVNSTPLTIAGKNGNVLNWLSSTDGITWTPIGTTADNYTAQNLSKTTRFAAVVQNGPSCSIDTSAIALVTVDPKTVPGSVTPADSILCAGQNVTPTLHITGNTGSVINWQRSGNSVTWNSFNPALAADSYTTGPVTATAYYRAIVKSGVCPADTSAPAAIRFTNVAYPVAAISPDSLTICYGKSATLNATISTGTNYTWSPSSAITNGGTGIVNAVPYTINATVTPPVPTNYILSVYNAGCPNALNDTFHIHVRPPIVVNAGRDTAVVINQPLQLHAAVNDPAANIYNWSPGTGLNFTNIADPLATYNASVGAMVTYAVTATTVEGCTGVDTINVKVFKTQPEIFMPSAFTPNGDGKNEVVYPICAGIERLNFFRLYNRWGQLVFSTSEMGKGWDGRIGGIQQSSDNYVYMVQGIDYMGRVINKKGNVVLLR